MNVKSNLHFIKRVEKKEKKIYTQINRTQKIAFKLLRKCGQMVNDFDFKKIRFSKILE